MSIWDFRGLFPRRLPVKWHIDWADECWWIESMAGFRHYQWLHFGLVVRESYRALQIYVWRLSLILVFADGEASDEKSL